MIEMKAWGREEYGLIQEVTTHRPMLGDYVPVRVIRESDWEKVERLRTEVEGWRELAERAENVIRDITAQDLEEYGGTNWLIDFEAAKEEG